jgi:hypothetical protein
VGINAFRPSSYSSANGGDCVEVGQDWRKSSYSSNGGADCVEAGSTSGAILIRDTKDRERGPVLRISLDAWAAFTTSLR